MLLGYLQSGKLSLDFESSLKFVKLCDVDFDPECWAKIFFTLYKRTRTVRFWMHLLIATLSYLLYSCDCAEISAIPVFCIFYFAKIMMVFCQKTFGI